jgi:hypothetical protein
MPSVTGNSREGSVMTASCAFGRRTDGQYCSVLRFGDENTCPKFRQLIGCRPRYLRKKPVKNIRDVRSGVKRRSRG